MIQNKNVGYLVTCNTYEFKSTLLVAKKFTAEEMV